MAQTPDLAASGDSWPRTSRGSCTAIGIGGPGNRTVGKEPSFATWKRRPRANSIDMCVVRISPWLRTFKVVAIHTIPGPILLSKLKTTAGLWGVHLSFADLVLNQLRRACQQMKTQYPGVPILSYKRIQHLSCHHVEANQH